MRTTTGNDELLQTISAIFMFAKIIGGHKSVNRLSVNNEANFFINSLIR